MSAQKQSHGPPDSLDTYKSIMERGLIPNRQPPLFPTLVIETDDEIRVGVLDPSPEPAEAFEVVMQWKQAVLDDLESTQLHCVGFVTRPGEITLGVFPPTDGTWFSGRINETTGKIEWSAGENPR